MGPAGFVVKNVRFRNLDLVENRVSLGQMDLQVVCVCVVIWRHK